jgi:hypothetical protein
MAVKSPIVADVKDKAILGTFEGECADANITNKNGLDITREVWENVFKSDDYKEAIEKKWYIGYLGHPEDPNCMNFQDACIVMTEGHIDDSGKIYGKFDLVDTPVGRIVKTFIDAGVTFGISVRGAGDIVGNSVDPETFVFRGFDIVTFPAFPESIPTFTEIAAATDTESRQKYKKICAAVDNNIDGLNTKESIEVIQSCFARQSDTFRKLEAKKAAITSEELEDVVDVEGNKIEALTELYVEASQACKEKDVVIASLKKSLADESKAHKRKQKTMERIMSAQLHDMDMQLASISSDRAKAIQASTKLRDKVSVLESQIAKNNQELKRSITASQDIQATMDTQSSKYANKIEALQKEIDILKADNLKYKQKIQSSTQAIQAKEDNIADLETKLNETVTAARSIQTASSNRDAELSHLRSELESAHKIIAEYQDAYANLYASAVGVSLNNVAVTGSTSVSQLKQMIKSTTAIEETAMQEISSLGDTDDGLVTL